jgi:transposase
MHNGKFVFAQICNFLPQRVFDGIVEKYNGNYRVKHFTCWNQMLCMIFGQLSNRDSLRDLVLTINAHPNKVYHLGFGKGISKSNLAKANETRTWMIFHDYAYYLIAEARRICSDNKFTEFSFSNPIYAVDATTIDLCLSVFWWATFRTAKGAIKLHTQYDVRTSIPVFIYITEGAVHDVNAMDVLNYEPGSFYIFDRGYLDFERLFNIHTTGSFFVIRAKINFKFKRQYSMPVDKSKGILYDQHGILDGFNSSKNYPTKIRRIKFHDKELNRKFIFITNNLDISAEEVALLYKNRWHVELFFKWIKQHLKIKSFWGESENAVKTQVYIAIITYTLTAIIRQQLKTSYTTYETLQILGTSLLDKTTVNQLLRKMDDQDFKELNHNSLTLF